ncbi:MAG TPA: HD-GYP domain-containing protein [Dissulfurispiraceae bacterium]|nr:HD-GYP domain-containing protein [Dissulfurispiraceae bacterium]
MLVKIKARDLRVGMHVVIPASWFDHPFTTGNFKIKSEDQILKIVKSGFHEVQIDTDKGDVQTRPDPDTAGGNNESEAVDIWKPGNLVPPALLEAIHDKNLAPQKRASVVYESSIELMGKLLEDPKAENIKEAKQGISEIVNMVFEQDDTSHYLLRITSHDFYTYTHSVNVGIFGIMLTKELFRRSDAHDMHELGAAFFLHDLGKIRIDPAIINKPGRLTDAEMEEMKKHPNFSYKILKETNQLSEECGIIAMQHHEREDGSGYPRGLKGDQIHTYGRVCSVADVYDALTAERSYKARLSSFEALKLMKEKMLSHFNQEIFEKFVLLFTEPAHKA